MENLLISLKWMMNEAIEGIFKMDPKLMIL